MKDDRLREKIENLFEHYEWIQFEGSTVLAIHPEEIAEAIEPLIVAELKAVKEELHKLKYPSGGHDVKEEKLMCSCGNPQSHPIPHEHDRTDREKAIIAALQAEIKGR